MPKMRSVNIHNAQNKGTQHKSMVKLVFKGWIQWRIQWAPHPPPSKLFHFHAVFWENLTKSDVGVPTSVKSWIRRWDPKRGLGKRREKMENKV